jgi:hypothetical protein
MFPPPHKVLTNMVRQLLHINPLKPDSSEISYVPKSPVPTQQATLLLQSEDAVTILTVATLL